jgi:NADH-quinone oxidoreductase subunit E
MSEQFNDDARPQNFRTAVMDIGASGDPSVFGANVRADAAEIIARYPVGQSRSALLPMLHLVQSEQGYVSPDGIAFCAEVLNLTKAQVAAVATFYTMYKRKPTGEYLVSVCTNTLCGLLGGDEIYQVLSETLGVKMNETTADGKITLEHAECLAACDYAPIVTVNYEFFDNQTVESARTVVDKLVGGERPLPSRGAPLCSFRQIERQIAGFFTAEDLSLESSGSGVQTEAGVKLAVERGESAPSYANEPGQAAPAKAPAAKAAPAKAAPAKAAATPAVPAESAQPTSAHDAPLQTADSDPDAPADDAQLPFPASGTGSSDTAGGE